MSKRKKVFLILILILIIGLTLFSYIYFYVPYSNSSREAGVINKIEHKGRVFKTYEGELILYEYGPRVKEGFPNRFHFSIVDKKLADRLISMKGYEVILHYKEYFGVLPWRGGTKFVVDSIIEVVPYNPDVTPSIGDEPPVDESPEI